MFFNLFDLSSERDAQEAVVFYFFYLIIVYFISGLLNSLTNFLFDINTTLTKFFFYLIGFIPFFFYMLISIAIIIKKRLQLRSGISYLVFCSIATFLMPLFIGISFGFGFLGYDGGMQTGILGTFMESFFLNLAIGGVPVAILTTKENHSLSKEIQQMEQEKIEHEQWIEKQLLIERTARMQQDKLNKQKMEYDEE